MFEQNVYPDILTTAVITNVYDYDTLLLAFIVHLRSSGSEWMKNRRLVASCVQRAVARDIFSFSFLRFAHWNRFKTDSNDSPIHRVIIYIGDKRLYTRDCGMCPAGLITRTCTST